ncbi:MAG: HDOD domain-containing protein [Acidimicrobiia bacterium]
MPRANLLVEEIAQLPVHPGVGMRILSVLDNPRSSARDLGRLIEADPALTTQVIRLANTAFYGVSGHIGSAWRAVTVLGHSTVRALAASAAFGLLSGQGGEVPDDFWSHATTSAAAAQTIAEVANVSSEDAFSAGMLLDLGQALMYRRSRAQYNDVVAVSVGHDVSLVIAEREKYGVSHAEVGAYALASLDFPESVVGAVRDHHGDPDLDDAPLTRVMIAAAALAYHLDGGTPESHIPIERALAALDIPIGQLPDLAATTTAALDDLSGFLTIAP